MKVVFISNYFNHHQKPFSDAMYQKIGGGYIFIETEEMDEERKNMGWDIKQYPSYVVSASALGKSLDTYIKLINDADVVIIGSAPERLIKGRKKLKKLIFRYSERPLKKGLEPLKYIPRLIKWRMKNPTNAPIYMLCASAYAAKDYAKFGLFKNKCYKWGYFTECKQYEDIDALISEKKANSILWVARFIDWKHPETPVEVARRLKADGYEFTLNIIGSGILEGKIKTIIEKEDLNDCVHMPGTMKPEKVREYMEKSGILMFTSDRGEGWGAVVNEAMNSGCAVVASNAAGAVPFLIDDGKNGMIYKDGNTDELFEKTKWLLDNMAERKKIAKNAYRTITELWNAENAAERLLVLIQNIIAGKNISDCLYECGPLSESKVVKKGEY